MKQIKQKRIMVILAVMVFALFILPAILYSGQKIVFEDGFLKISDDCGNSIEKIKLNPLPKQIFNSPSKQRYLLIYEDTNNAALLYDSNGTKLNKIEFLRGEIVALSDNGHIVEKISDVNSTTWQIYDTDGSIYLEMPNDLEIQGVKFGNNHKLIIWGKFDSYKSILKIYDKNKKIIYERIFCNSLQINKVTTCPGTSKLAVLTSVNSYGYYQDSRCTDHNNHENSHGQYELHCEISVFMIDYLKGIQSSGNVLKVKELNSVKTAVSANGKYVAWVVNNSEIVLFDVNLSKPLYVKSLITSINWNTGGEIIQTRIGNNGTVCTLRYYNAKDNNFLLFESCNKDGKTKKMRIFENMGLKSKMNIVWSNIEICDGTKKENFSIN